MRVYNVEIFDKDFLCVHHDLIDAASLIYREDYILYGKNSVNIKRADGISEGYYISISGDEDRFFGVIRTVEDDEGTDMTISYSPFYSLFDLSILFDTNLQGSGQALESVIGNYISAYRVNNADTVQNISAIGTITTTSNTTSWGFNIKPDKEDQHYCICNFYHSIITTAFSKYGVVIDCIPDMRRKKVDINIGKVADGRIITIETGLKGILSSSVIAGHLNTEANKLVVYNGDNYSQVRNYYLHPDGSYDMVNRDRLDPVHYKMEMVDPDDTKTFAQLADEKAVDILGKATFDNNISIEMLPDNPLFTPKQLPFGQQVRIVHNGSSYTSIVSKKEIKETLTLTFGTIRVELTNLLKGGYFNG